jgi:phage-related protein
LNEVVDRELNALPQNMRVRFVRISQLIHEFGPFQVGMPHIKSLNNKFWEIRVSGRDGIASGIYVIVKEKRVVVRHVFIKKTQEIPTLALQTALRRAKKAELI